MQQQIHKNNFASQIKQNQNGKNKFSHTHAKDIWMFQHSVTHPAIQSNTIHSITPPQRNNH